MLACWGLAVTPKALYVGHAEGSLCGLPLKALYVGHAAEGSLCGAAADGSSGGICAGGNGARLNDFVGP